MNRNPIIPKISGMDIPIELYRKNDDGRTQKAIVTVRELIERYSIMQQMADVIFANHTVEEFDISEFESEFKPKVVRTPLKSTARIRINEAMAALIKSARVKAGLTQDQVTTKIHVSSMFSNIAEKAKGDVYEEKLKEYCDVIGLDIAEVLSLQ